MANEQVQITVQKVGPYGVMAGGQWFGISPKASLQAKQFSVGQTYTVVLYVSGSGKPYINAVTGGQLLAPEAPAVTPAAPPVVVPATTAQATPAPITFTPTPKTYGGRPSFAAKPARGGESQEDYEKRQKQIIRQSSLSTAAEVAAKGSDAQTIIKLAEAFEAWVNR